MLTMASPHFELHCFGVWPVCCLFVIFKKLRQCRDILGVPSRNLFFCWLFNPWKFDWFSNNDMDFGVWLWKPRYQGVAPCKNGWDPIPIQRQSALKGPLNIPVAALFPKDINRPYGNSMAQTESDEPSPLLDKYSIMLCGCQCGLFEASRRQGQGLPLTHISDHGIFGC